MALVSDLKKGQRFRTMQPVGGINRTSWEDRYFTLEPESNLVFDQEINGMFRFDIVDGEYPSVDIAQGNLKHLWLNRTPS